MWGRPSSLDLGFVDIPCYSRSGGEEVHSVAASHIVCVSWNAKTKLTTVELSTGTTITTPATPDEIFKAMS